MAWSFAQFKANFGDAGASSIATGNFASAPAGGNLIVVGITHDYSSGQSLTSVQDTRGNSYTQAGTTADDAATTTKFYLYYAKNIVGGTNSVTANFSAGTTLFRRIVAAEYFGVDPTNPLVATNSRVAFSSTTATDNATTNPNSATPTSAGQLVVGLVGTSDGTNSNLIVAGTGFNGRGPDGSTTGGPLYLEDRAAVDMSATDCTWTMPTANTNRTSAFIAVFADAWPPPGSENAPETLRVARSSVRLA